MAATTLKEALQSAAKDINASQTKQKKLKEWVGTYRGKIILFKPLGGQPYHLIATKDKVEIQEGEYPSVDATYTGDEQSLVQVVQGKTPSYDMVKKGALSTSQNMHETFRLEEVLRS